MIRDYEVMLDGNVIATIHYDGPKAYWEFSGDEPIGIGFGYGSAESCLEDIKKELPKSSRKFTYMREAKNEN